MKQHKKCTYTLDRRVINIIERRSFLCDISKSKLVSNCIELGYQMMVNDYYDNDKQPLVGVKKKRRNTTPITLSLGVDVLRNLEWFSDKLGMKKSHLVSASIINYEQIESDKLEKQIDKLMKSVE
jgi:hypothetical protein